MSAADRQLSLRLEEQGDPAIVRRMRALGRKAKKAAEQVTGKKPIEGFVDRVLAGEIQGWAFDPNKPARRVHIVARHEGEIIAETLADLPRKDLTRGGKGDGKHGFNLRIPADFLDGKPRRLKIEASSGRSKVLLRRGEITVAANRPSGAQRKPKPAPSSAAPSGALEGVANGMLLGWAAQPKSGGAPAVVDIYDDERYLGSVTADRPRPRREDEPRGARSFHFRLPEGFDEPMLRRLRARLTGTQVDLRALQPIKPTAEPVEETAAVVATVPAPGRVVRPERRMALLVFGSEAEEPLKRTMRSWSEQGWPALDIGRVSERDGQGATAFGPGDAMRLRSFMASAEALAVIRAGETVHSGLAGTLSLADPVADILIWERAGAAPRRSEAWPLAIQLGQSMAGGYAIRTHGLSSGLDRLSRAAVLGERALETELAATPLRWRALPALLSSAPQTPPELHEPAQPPDVSSVSLGVWPGWTAEAKRTLLDLVARLEGVEVEVLVPAGADADRDEIRAAGKGRVFVRTVDTPAAETAGTWLRRLSEAAAGETVLLFRAGLAPGSDAGLLPMMRWAMSPLAGAVTGAFTTAQGAVAGVTVASTGGAWRVTPAAPVEGSAPVLAAPGSFMAVGRGKLAAVGGFDDQRFPAEAADLDLCLRLRRMGWHSLALAHVQATFDGSVFGDGLAMALMDQGELAGAAAAYPAAEA